MQTLWAETTGPGSPRGEWAEPGRGRGPGERGHCVGSAELHLSALGAGRATVVIAGVELEVSAAITVPAGDQVRATTLPLAAIAGRGRRASGATCR